MEYNSYENMRIIKTFFPNEFVHFKSFTSYGKLNHQKTTFSYDFSIKKIYTFSTKFEYLSIKKPNHS